MTSHHRTSHTFRHRTPAASASYPPDRSTSRDYPRDDSLHSPSACSCLHPAIRATAPTSQKYDPHSSDRPPRARSTSPPSQTHCGVPTSLPCHSIEKFRPCHPPPQWSRKRRWDPPEKPPAQSAPCRR